MVGRPAKNVSKVILGSFKLVRLDLKGGDIVSSNVMKSSAQRGIKKQIAELYPSIEGNLEDILPKKGNLTQVKWYPV